MNERSLDDFIAINELTVGQLSGLGRYAVKGYTWATDLEVATKWYPIRQHAGPRWLVPAGGRPQRPVAYRAYPTFRDARCRELHRKFARLGDLPSAERQEAGYLQFANRFGHLGPRETLTPLQPSGQHEAGSPTAAGEALDYWRYVVAECAALVGLWDLARTHKREQLARHITVEGSRSRDRRISLFVAWDATQPKGMRLATDRRCQAAYRITAYGPSADAYRDERDSLGPGPYLFSALPGVSLTNPDVVEIARAFIYNRISDHLFNHVGVALRAEREPAQALTVVPHSLIGAIYLHFAREMSGKAAPGVPCGNPRCDQLVVKDWGKEYCDNRCRDQARYYRDRSKDARAKQRAVGTDS